MYCAQCSSDNLTRLSLIYAAGTAHTTSRSSGTGIGFAGGRIGVGFGSSVSHGTTHSTQAHRAAPPVKKRYNKRWWIIGLFVVVMSGAGHPILSALLPLGYIALAVWRLGLVRQYNTVTYPMLYTRWEMMFQCNRCGHIGEPTMNQPVAAQHVEAVTSTQTIEQLPADASQSG